MRWKHNNTEIGDKRTRKKFLLLPKTIVHETRWLEQTEFEEEYVTIVVASKSGPTTKERWVSTKWI